MSCLKSTQKTSEQTESSPNEANVLLFWRWRCGPMCNYWKRPQHNGEILSKRIISAVRSVLRFHNRQGRQNPSKTEKQSPRFWSLITTDNYRGELWTKWLPHRVQSRSLERIASSPSFYCPSPSPSLFSLSVFSLARFPSVPLFSTAVFLQGRIMHAGVFPTKKILAQSKQEWSSRSHLCLRGLNRKSVVWCVDTSLFSGGKYSLKLSALFKKKHYSCCSLRPFCRFRFYFSLIWWMFKNITISYILTVITY